MKVLQGCLLPAGFLTICSLWTETPTPTHPSNKRKSKQKLKNYAKLGGYIPRPTFLSTVRLSLDSTCCLIPFHAVAPLLCFLNLLENKWAGVQDQDPCQSGRLSGKHFSKSHCY